MATRGSSIWRSETWGSPCKPQLVAMPIYAGGPRFQANILARDAFIQLGAVFLKNGYVIRRAGCYNCRAITGGHSYSSHSWATSVDVNDDTNPYRTDRLVTDIPNVVIRDTYAIKTAGGVQVFRWGGDWDGRPDTRNSNYDAMHFEIVATPGELAQGFISQPGEAHPEKVLTWPVLRRGAKGPAVIELQRLLKLGNTTGVGEFGPRTETAVILYQKSRGLVADGIVGHGTWTALLTNQLPLVVSGVAPQKVAA
jgi:hypothetical protein